MKGSLSSALVMEETEHDDSSHANDDEQACEDESRSKQHSLKGVELKSRN